MSEDTDKTPYDVGYARPPKDSRFKPGQSGNPRGRARGAKNTSTIVRDALMMSWTALQPPAVIIAG